MALVSVAAAAAKSLQSCPTLCDPTDGSPPGSPIPGILQARTLEWVAIVVCVWCVLCLCPVCVAAPSGQRAPHGQALRGGCPGTVAPAVSSLGRRAGAAAPGRAQRTQGRRGTGAQWLQSKGVQAGFMLDRSPLVRIPTSELHLGRGASPGPVHRPGDSHPARAGTGQFPRSVRDPCPPGSLGLGPMGSGLSPSWEGREQPRAGAHFSQGPAGPEGV